MIYEVIRGIARIILKPLFRISAEGIEAVPSQGPVIIAANHKSWLDPVFLGIILRRKIRFMAKEELFKYPLFSWLIRKLGAFPVKRGSADRKALRSAIDILKAGGIVGIFVEGTRVKKEGIGELRPGAYFLAKMGEAPVVLAAIRGNRPLFKKKLPPVPEKVRIKFKIFDADLKNLKPEEYLLKMRKELEELWESLK